MMKQMMISKHFNISIGDSDQMTPFDLNFYYKKTEEMLKAQKEQMQQAYKQ